MIQHILDALQRLYTMDERPWVVGYLKEIEQRVTDKKEISLDTLCRIGSKQIQTTAQGVNLLCAHCNA